MKKIFASIALLLSMHGAALALSNSAIPVKIPTSWGASAPGGNITCPIPIPSQISITAGRASWTDGFPPVTFLPAGSGGIPPFGQDFNGVLCQISQWSKWYNAGAPIAYDATFQSAIGGYPNGSIVGSSSVGFFWVSTIDNNLSSPDAGGANWQDLYFKSHSATYAGTAGGSANALTLSIHGWLSNTTNIGVPIQFVPASVNTGAATLIINGVGSPVSIQKKTFVGLQNLVGGELQPGQIAVVTFDGSVYELQSASTSRFNIVFITVTGNYVPSAGLTSAYVQCVGGGGGGGGAVSTSGTQLAAGGGGASGTISMGTFTTAQLSGLVPVTIGAGGAGVAANSGNTGGSTLFGSALNAPGGNGGGISGAVGAGSLALAPGGAPLTFGSVGAAVIPGSPGQTGLIFNLSSGGTTLAISGAGANGFYGSGGGQPQNSNASGAGNPGTAYGSGGSGAAVSVSQPSKPGGNGANGACLIVETIAQ